MTYKIRIGGVSEQSPGAINPKYRGGEDQILPQHYPHSWIKKIRDLKTGKTYTYDEFIKLFLKYVTR